MDETALIALGILIEETAKETLGETGDLAFLEAADEEEAKALAAQDEREQKRMKRSASKNEEVEEESESSLWSSSGDASTEDSE